MPRPRGILPQDRGQQAAVAAPHVRRVCRITNEERPHEQRCEREERAASGPLGRKHSTSPGCHHQTQTWRWLYVEDLEPDVTDPGTLRAALARSELHRYELAARVKRDPSTLSQWLNGHKPIPVDVSELILRECAKGTRKSRAAALVVPSNA